MTISNQAASTTGIGNGVTTSWPYLFLIPYQDDGVTPAASVYVTNTNVVPNVVTLLPPSQYGITGVGNASGGAVSITPALAAGYLVTIIRSLLYTQGIAVPNQGFFPNTVEQMGDRLEEQIQQLAEGVGRAMRAPYSDGAVDMTVPPKGTRISTVAGYDSNGLPSVIPYSSIPALILSNATNAVATVTLMKALVVTIASVGTVVYLEGYAAAGDGGGGMFYITNVNPGADNGGTIIWSNTAGYYFLRDTQSKALSVKWFGAKADGITNDRVAIQAAIAAAQVIGGEVFFPAGAYLINSVASGDIRANGIVVPFTDANAQTKRVTLTFARGARLLAGSNSMIVLRLSDCYSVVNGPNIDGNGHTSVWGIALVPEDMDQTAAIVYQDYNCVRDAHVFNCQEGIVLACGPDVAGGDSGCWYNTFYNAFIYACIRGILLASGPNVGASGPNRNKFFGTFIGSVSNTNTGITIAAGAENKFHGVDFEGIVSAILPNPTPTGIAIANTDAVGGGDNNSNRFFDCDFEAVTRHVENANPYSEFSGCSIDKTKVLFTAKPLYCSGGGPAASTPQIWNGQEYNTSSLMDRTTGTSASIANGATFTITIPTVGPAFELAVISSSNYTSPHLSYFGTDGVSAVTPTILKAGLVTLTILANTITVTNNSGGAAVFNWALSQRTALV